MGENAYRRYCDNRKTKQEIPNGRLSNDSPCLTSVAPAALSDKASPPASLASLLGSKCVTRGPLTSEPLTWFKPCQAAFRPIAPTDTTSSPWSSASLNKIQHVLYSAFMWWMSHQHQDPHGLNDSLLFSCTTTTWKKSHTLGNHAHISTTSRRAPTQRGTDTGQSLNRLNLISSHLFLREPLLNCKPPGTWDSDATQLCYERLKRCLQQGNLTTNWHFWENNWNILLKVAKLLIILIKLTW